MQHVTVQEVHLYTLTCSERCYLQTLATNFDLNGYIHSALSMVNGLLSVEMQLSLVVDEERIP